ncbi:lipid-A-disaccharide synthase-related protein [bacterium]|nr:lipid-A-disaccharide synthase-related protein [bacterium]
MSIEAVAERRVPLRQTQGPSEVPKAAWVLLHVAFFLLPLASVLSAVILLGLGTYFAWRKTRVEVPIPGKSWSLLMALVALSAATSVAPGLSAVAILLFGAYFTLIWVVGLMLDSPQRVWSLCRNVFWTTVFWAVFGVGLVYSRIFYTYQSPLLNIQLGTWDHRAASIFYHPNILSAYLILASGIGMMLMLQRRRKERIVVGLGLAAIMLCQVLTSSRSGWIGTIATFLLIGILVDRRILITLVGGISAALMAFWPMILPRLQTLGQMDFTSNHHRVLVWKSALAMIRERPLTGWGPGTWPMVYPQFEDPLILEKMPHAHNMYLMIGAEFGLLVLVVLLGVFISLVVKSALDTRKTPWHAHVAILGCTIVGYLLVGFFDFIFTEGRNSILFFGMLGMLVAMRRFKPEPQRETKRILFMSNGFGEDRIASTIAKRWPRAKAELWAMPIVGEGNALRAAGAAIVGPTQSMPSGGFILRSPRALFADLYHGLAGLTIRQLLAVRAVRGQVDLVVAVGDVVPLYFAWLSGAPFVFVGCAKSDYYLGGRFGSYGLLERWFIRHPRCRAVYPRDGVTTRNLEARGFLAHDLGNPMMDDLQPTGRPLPQREGAVSIGILPGSRDEAYANLEALVETCRAVALEAPAGRKVDFLAAIAESLDVSRLAAAIADKGWKFDADAQVLSGPEGVRIALCRGRFGDWIHRVEAVIGMAGTANEQCVGMGLPVFTFPGSGPQFNPAFAEAQTRLLGESVVLCPPVPEAIATKLWEVMNDPERLARIRENGRTRMGLPGASARIAEHASGFVAP